MNLLEHPLVRKYFGCEGETQCCPNHMEMKILQAMQEPIVNGERYLFFTAGQWLENDAGEYLISFHPKELRLPDQFQPKPQTANECDHQFSALIFTENGIICKRCSTVVKLSTKIPSMKTFFAPTETGVKDVWAKGDPANERKECQHRKLDEWGHSVICCCKREDEVGEKIQEIRNWHSAKLQLPEPDSMMEYKLRELVELARKK